LKHKHNVAHGDESKTTEPQLALFFPMLLKTYNGQVDDKVGHPGFYIQPKLNGVRCVCVFGQQNKVVMYSRELKLFGNNLDYIRSDVSIILAKLPSRTYLDGELYAHGVHLQDISGAVRNNSSNIAKTLNIKFHIFDWFNPLNPFVDFDNRIFMLKTVNKLITENQLRNVETVQTVPSQIVQSIEKCLDKFIKAGYEGIVIRKDHSLYMAGNTKTSILRCPDTYKLKRNKSEEFPIIGFTTGTRGKEVGAIIWVCVTKNGMEFKVKPINLSLQQRKAMFTQCQQQGEFEKVFKGRRLTVTYEELSKTGIPLRGKGEIRDHL